MSLKDILQPILQPEMVDILGEDIADWEVLPPESPITVGGLTVGQAGSGLRSGYTLRWADGFDGDLDIVHPGNPRGRYFTTRTYQRGARCSDTALATMFDTDPFFTGHNDSNRGVAVGYDNMSQAGGALSLLTRKATVPEQAHMINARNEVSAMISGAGAVYWFCGNQVTNDIQFEADIVFSAAAGNPRGAHATFWCQSLDPSVASDSDEQDFESNSTGGKLKWNLWEADVHTGSLSGSTLVPHDGTPHVYSMRVNTTFDRLFLDLNTTQIESVTGNCNTHGKPATFYLTNHVFSSGAFDGESYVAADFDTKSMLVEIRSFWLWSKTGKAHYKPLINFFDQNVDYGGTLVITLPSPEIVWGTPGAHESFEHVHHEENEPGVTHLDVEYPFPAGVSYDTGTRQLTVNITEPSKTGRMHFMLKTFDGELDGTASSTGEPLRFCVNVGPRITLTDADLTFEPGAVVDIDLYDYIDCGVLVPKTFSLSGNLTGSGLTYNSGTGHLSGTVAEGVFPNITITGTNSLGQSVTATRTITVETAASFVFADDFNRANESLEVSANWTRAGGVAGDCSVSGNACRAVSTNATGAAYLCPDIGTADMYVQAKWMNTATAGGPFICARLTDANNYVGARRDNANGRWDLFKRVTGTLSSLGNFVGAIVAGDVLRLECSGDNATLLVNGVIRVGPVSLAGSHAGVTDAGLNTRSTFQSPWIDDFEAGAL
jgi:hypothetical protein